MGYDKEKLSKLLRLVETIYNDKGPEVKEFTAGIDALSMSNVKGNVKLPVYPAEKLDDIYEYCLARNLRKQANNFYSGFPLINSTDELVQGFVSMEESKRRDDFLGFCRELFRQIETVLNSICKDPKFDEMAHRMFNHVMPQKQPNKPPQTVADTIYYKFRKSNSGEDMALWLLSKQHINNKFAIVEFFVCEKYRPTMGYLPQYIDKKDLFSKLAIVRNFVHGGGMDNFSEYQKAVCQDVLAAQSEYYFRFSNLLYEFMSAIRAGYPMSEEQYSMQPIA